MKGTKLSSATATILPAESEHLKSIASLAETIWRAHYPGIISHAQIDYMLELMYNLEAMERELKEGIRYDRLLLGEKLVGFASYGTTDRKSEIKIHKLYIHPDFQRIGLGSLLLKHAETSARKSGLGTLILSVNKTNCTAIAAYHKNGFSIRESIVVDIGGGFAMDDYVMGKKLHKTE